MQIISEIKSSTLVCAPYGRIDSNTSDGLDLFLKNNFTDNITELVLDFANVDFISSMGLRVLISVYKSLNGKNMRIINANSSVREVFALSGLLKIFNLDSEN